MLRLLAVLTVLALFAAGCGTDQAADSDPDPEPGSGSEPEPADPAAPGTGLTAVATVFPLAWLTTQIAPGADVAFLGSRGQDPHDLELSPGDRERLESADLLVYMGELDFQPQVEAATAATQGAVVDVAAVAGPARLRDFDHDHDEDADEDGHGHGHGHDDEDENADEDGHDEDGAIDPHVWFDAPVMAEVAEVIGATLAAIDPANATDYTANAAVVAGDLRDLDEEIDALLSGCRHETAYVSHEAYAYLLEPRDLHQEGISGAGGHAEASPQRLAELTGRIRDAGIAAVAAEPFEGRADAEALATEAGVDIIDIDPLEVVTDEQYAVGYPQMLRQQAEAFAAVLECG